MLLANQPASSHQAQGNLASWLYKIETRGGAAYNEIPVGSVRLTHDLGRGEARGRVQPHIDPLSLGIKFGVYFVPEQYKVNDVCP